MVQASSMNNCEGYITMAQKTERLQVPIDAGLRHEIERAAKEQDSSCAQVMRSALRAWADRRKRERTSAGDE
jgi:CRISPR/Cas system-associated exonuclease Cas4 (RecB family)